MELTKDYLALHPQFEYSYFLIGLLEINLRERIPMALRNYGSLWLPVLSEVSPRLLNAKDLTSFRRIDKYFDTALRLRNNVAHYNLSSGQTLQFSQEKVKWLLLNLDISDELLVKAEAGVQR